MTATNENNSKNYSKELFDKLKITVQGYTFDEIEKSFNMMLNHIKEHQEVNFDISESEIKT